MYLFRNIIFILFILSGFYLNAQSTQLYSTKSGVIKYDLNGRKQGSEVIYFDNYGKLFSDLRSTTAIIAGDTIEESYLNIYKHDTLFEINLNKHTFILSKSTGLPNSNKLISAEMIDVLGYKNCGTEEIAGISCNIYSGDYGKLWIWNNIVLKSEMEIMDIIITTQATTYLTNIEIPESKFEIPKKLRQINQ